MPEMEFFPKEHIKERKIPPPPPGARKEKAVPPPWTFREKKETVPSFPGLREKKSVPPPLPPEAREKKAVPPPLPPEAKKPKLEVIEKEKKFEFAGGVKTTTSPDHPDRNEDNFFLAKRKGFGAVFDGMGGAAAGEVASFEASRAILEQLKDLPEDISSHETEKKIFEAILAANDRIKKIVEAHPEYRGMGCTASIVKLCENGRKIVIGQIGDSRIYRLREGKLERISPEDSYVEILKKYGFIKDDQDVTQSISVNEVVNFCNQKLRKTTNLEEATELSLLRYTILSAGQYKQSLMSIAGKPFDGRVTIADIRHLISNAIDGEKHVKPHILTLNVKEGDQYIITSDGIHDNLTDAEIQNIGLQFHGRPQEMSEALVKASYSRMFETRNPRAKTDDATAVVISVAKIEAVTKEEKEAKMA
jgi:protein phosphatase